MLPLLLALLILGPPASAQVSISGQFDPAGAKQAAGRSVSFTCQVTNKQPLLSVRLTCPLAKVGTVCFENCNRICADPSLCAEEPRLLRVTCSESSAGSVQTFAYRLDMLDTGFSGDWGCKHVTYESTPRSLTVYPSPAIDSLDFTAATVVESQSTAALCVAQPTVGSLRFSWTRRDGLSIPHSSSGPNATASRLTIASAQRTDDAVYACTVENEVGVSASREAGLTVNYPPSSVRLSSSLSSPLQAGVSVTFACQVDGGRPEPLRRFYRERLGQSREELPAATVTLEAADNAAKFYCKAESVGIIGTEVWSSPIAFSVFFPPSGLELLQQPPGPATDGGPAKQFSCSATSSSNPPSSAAWYSISPLGLQEQISDSRVSVSQTDGPNSAKQLQSRLDIAASRDLNGFKFRCVLLYNSREIGRKDVALEVKFPPSSSALTASPADGVLENTALTLLCRAGSANPPARVHWFRQPRGGASSAENVTVQAVATTEPAENLGTAVSSRLLVTQTRRADNGTVYTCAIVYDSAAIGALSKSTSVLVLYPPSVNVTVSPSSPREGDSVTLCCLTTGGSPDGSGGGFTFVWRHRNASGVWATLASATSTLSIASASSGDNGVYQCSVGSRGGSATASAALNLTFAPAAWPGTQLAVSSPLGQPAELLLRVTANPPPSGAVWQRLGADGTKQALNPRLSTVSSAVNLTYRLVIPEVTSADYGNYVCTVANSVGTRDFTFSLNRPGPPATPSGLQVLNTTAVSANLRWRSEFNGGFEQTFTLQWRPLGSSVWSVANQKTGLRDPGFGLPVTETVTALESQATYYARVRAENFYGGAINVSPFTDEVALTTRKLPLIPDASVAAQVTSGQLEIQFTAPMSPHYTGVYVKLCSPGCVLRQLLESEVRSGRASILLPDPQAAYSFSLLVLDGSVTVYETRSFDARLNAAASTTQASTASAGLSFEIVLGISIGSAVVVAILLAAVIVTAILQCRRGGGDGGGGPGVGKSMRSTNSSDVTNGSGGSPAAIAAGHPVCGQAVQLGYRASLSSGMAPQDGYYCPPPPALGSDCGCGYGGGGGGGGGGGFSPGSRMSAQEAPLHPSYYSYHLAGQQQQQQQQQQQHHMLMMAAAAAASRQRLNGTSNGSLNSQQPQQQHGRMLTPDLVQSETPAGDTELIRYSSRISLASSRSGFSVIPATSSAAVTSMPAATGASSAPPVTGATAETAFAFPSGGGGGGGGGFRIVAGNGGLSDIGAALHSLQQQPTFVASPLTPHLESNMEAIENYV